MTGSASVGSFLPITVYSFKVPLAFILLQIIKNYQINGSMASFTDNIWTNKYHIELVIINICVIQYWKLLLQYGLKCKQCVLHCYLHFVVYCKQCVLHCYCLNFMVELSRLFTLQTVMFLGNNAYFCREQVS